LFVSILIYMAGRTALHYGSWLGSFDRIAANQEIINSKGAGITATVSTAAPQLANSLIQGGAKMQMAFDSVQGSADKASDVLDNVRDTTAEMIDVAGSGNKLITHVTNDTLPINGTIINVGTMPQHVNAALDELPPLEKAFTFTIAETGNYIHGPLTFTTNNLGEITDNTNTWLYPPPCKERNPLHITRCKWGEFGKGVLRTAPPIISGTAGAIALTEGK